MIFRVVDPNGLARLWGNHKVGRSACGLKPNLMRKIGVTLEKLSGHRSRRSVGALATLTMCVHDDQQQTRCIPGACASFREYAQDKVLKEEKGIRDILF